MLRLVVSRHRSAHRLQTTSRALFSTSDVKSEDKTEATSENKASSSEQTPVVAQVKSSQPEITLPKKMRPQDRPKKQPWYYAVRKGREIGVFKTWDEAKGKVLGFSGAIFKPFKDEQRAKKWLEKDISLIDPADLPQPKQSAEEKASVQAPRYVLNFATALSTVEDSERKGLMGMGWIVRKFPERTLVVAGCDLYDVQAWKKEHPSRPGYNPKLPRELPLLESLNRALDDVKRVFKLEDATSKPSTSSAEGDNKKATATAQSKLDFPLQVKSDHVYTVGLLTSANPTLPELVKPLKSARAKLYGVAATLETDQISPKENAIAQGLAKAALVRKNPRCTIEGGSAVPTYARLMAALNQTPDVPPNVNPVGPGSAKSTLEVNGVPIPAPEKKAKQA